LLKLSISNVFHVVESIESRDFYVVMHHKRMR